jgi:quinol monooxygenase YgiN
MRYLFGTLIAAFVFAPLATAQEHPIEAEVKASLKDLTKPFTLVVRLKVKDGSGPKFEEAFAKAAAETLKEKGNKGYEMSRSAKDANEFLVYERWQNFASLQAHLKAPYFGELIMLVTGILDGAPEIKVFIPTGK